MDDLPPELSDRRELLYGQVTKRGRWLRRRRLGGLAAVVVMVLVVPIAAVALNVGNGDHRVRVAASDTSTTESTTDTASTSTSSTTEETATTVPTTVGSTVEPVTTPATADPTTSTTLLVCHNSTDPACGPLRYEPPIAIQPATLTLVRIEPAAPVVGDKVSFVVHATDPAGTITAGDTQCASEDFGAGSVVTVECDCAGTSQYGPWDLPAPPPSDVTFAFTHVYAKAGTFHVKLAVAVSPCSPWWSSATTAFTVTVGAG